MDRADQHQPRRRQLDGEEQAAPVGLDHARAPERKRAASSSRERIAGIAVGLDDEPRLAGRRVGDEDRRPALVARRVEPAEQVEFHAASTRPVDHVHPNATVPILSLTVARSLRLFEADACPIFDVRGGRRMALVVEALWDDEASVWVATSDDIPGLVTEADTLDELRSKLADIVPELLAGNDPSTLRDWPLPIADRRPAAADRCRRRRDASRRLEGRPMNRRAKRLRFSRSGNEAQR